MHRQPFRTMGCLVFTCALPCFWTAPLTAGLRGVPPREVIALDGLWQVEEGDGDGIPSAWSHQVPVPGLIDMAVPKFEKVGQKSALRNAFWYRRTFRVAGALPEIALLKVHKARYGTKVFLNGSLVGEHLPCFTPALLDVRRHLKGDGGVNELIVRVGADRECLSEGQPTGWDFEKYLFIPGIYDSVELILTGAPYVENVQAVPDVRAKAVRVVSEIRAGGRPCDVTFAASVSEARSGHGAGAAADQRVSLAAGQLRSIDLTIPIENCRLWSPDDPFLYELKVSTGADAAKVRFGMRTFRFDLQTKRPILNDQPHYLRGTNVCVYRFFEDANRGDRPWREEWVRRLHRQFKSMHWEAIRYCIGFPPEVWYDVADEEGFLIQDEFPIWLLNRAPEKPTAEKIIPEYTEWMRERWNHPCVVIWDGQNESVSDQTGKAIRAVRGLDLSNRPWENGWEEPQGPGDCVESHPYLFSRLNSGKGTFKLSDLAHTSPVPALHPAQKKFDVPIIINEYDWLWLNRDGTPTCLTQKVYDKLLGPGSTTEQRRVLRARSVAALTEFWRCHREAAGVLHFCGLGYSRAGDKPRPEGGATCDDFTDIEQLTFEPNFRKYVRDAFNPVGLMVDFWDEQLPGAVKRSINVYVVNDLQRPWSGSVRLALVQGDRTISSQTQSCAVAPAERVILNFAQEVPGVAGNYQLAAEIDGDDGAPVRSLRDFAVVNNAAH